MPQARLRNLMCVVSGMSQKRRNAHHTAQELRIQTVLSTISASMERLVHTEARAYSEPLSRGLPGRTCGSCILQFWAVPTWPVCGQIVHALDHTAHRPPRGAVSQLNWQRLVLGRLAIDLWTLLRCASEQSRPRIKFQAKHA